MSELRKRERKFTGWTGGRGADLNVLKGIVIAQRERPTKHRMPPAPFEEVEARRGPGRKRRPRNRRHGRPRGR